MSMGAAVEDLTGRGYWDRIYCRARPVGRGWHPTDYDAFVLERALMAEIDHCQPKSLLEVGCGNSAWLPYLARNTGASVAGIDYSKPGCELVRQSLKAEGISGHVYNVDFLTASVKEIGRYDFVFSLGVVEHFAELDVVLSHLLAFVNPGGVLWTEVPNLRSIHGLLSWVWNPKVLAKHRLVGKTELVRAYHRLGLTGVRAGYRGLFSFNVVPWVIDPPIPALLPMIHRFDRWVDARLSRVNRFWGVQPFAPYICAVGRKPDGRN